MKTSRRQFITRCTGCLSALATSRLINVVLAGPKVSRTPQTLVIISLRGGLDSLNLVGPAGDADYIAARPNELRIAEDGDQKGLDLGKWDGQSFMLHPAAAPLFELYQQKHLGMIHACGLTNGTRSHFEAMDLMERGVADMKDKHLATGWLARYLAVNESHSIIPGAAIGGNLPTSLLGSPWAYSLSSPQDFALSAGEELESLLRSFHQSDGSVEKCGQGALKALKAVRSKLPRDENGNPRPYEPEKNANYPNDGNNGLGASLKSLAQLLKMDVGLEVATVEMGGFDTHENQPNTLPNLLTELSQSLHGFWNDVAAFHQRLTVVVVSEFGRRVKSNESSGTDHGLGGLCLVLGGQVKGGRLLGQWPGLATEKLDDSADLAVTTDYRGVLSEVLTHNGLLKDQLAAVLPGYKIQKPLGLFA